MMRMRLPRFSSRRIIILSENKKFNQREPRLYLNKKISGHHIFCRDEVADPSYGKRDDDGDSSSIVVVIFIKLK